MIEFLATVIITVSSVLLFCYWFRYTCLLILSAKTTRDYAGEVAAANQLGFLGVQAQLREGGAELDRLRHALDRDYDVLSRLLEASAHSSKEESSLECRMLGVNYRLTAGWFRISNRFSPSAARRALEEMSMVVSHMANIMGERATAGAAA
jgi:hypothetical protein